MEDLIYILLGLLWLVFTFYSQNKKKKEKQLKAEKQHQDQNEGDREALEDIFGEWVEEDEPKEVEIIEPIPNSQPKRSFENQYEDLGIDSVEKTGKNYHTEAENPIKETSILNQEVIEKQEIVSTKNEIRSLEGKSKKGNSNFDLRKALIYHAIMDTPYI